MSDACEMVEACGRHQHPELFGRREVDTACSWHVAREILAMTTDQAPLEPSPTRRDRTRADWWPDGR